MKKITIRLENLDQAIKEIENYKKEVERKSNLLRQKIAERIENGTRLGFAGADVNVTVKEDGNTSIIIASGPDVIFIEFGAGVYYNTPVGTSPHPKGGELGFTIGSYGKGKGKRETWAYFDEVKGEYIYTHGTQSLSPMWKAYESVLQDIPAIAREIFK